MINLIKTNASKVLRFILEKVKTHNIFMTCIKSSDVMFCITSASFLGPDSLSFFKVVVSILLSNISKYVFNSLTY